MISPPTRRDTVVDVFHGVEVADPYRWLEAGDDVEVVAWVAAQNELTRAALDGRPDRVAWHARLRALFAAPISTEVRVGGDRVFALERRDGAAQRSLVVRPVDEPGGPARTVLDPTTLTADATASIDWYHPSPDGRLVAYGISEGGDERSTLYVLDVERGERLADAIPDTRAASVGWLPDGRGFCYTRYPEGDEYHRMVYEHRLGTAWRDDPLVWGDLPKSEAWPDVAVSPDGRHVLVHVEVGWGRTDVHLLDRAGGEWRTVIAGPDALSVFRFDGDRILGTTTLGAPRGRVVAAPLEDPASWTTLVPESDAVLDDVRPVAGGFLVLATERAVGRLTHHAADGAPVGPVALPGAVSFAGFDTARDRPLAFVQLEGFTRPASLFRWTPDGLRGWGDDPPSGGPDPDGFVVEQERYPSLDGTEIGLFVVRAATTAPAAGTPAILTGYGGFALAKTPAYSPLATAWCEAGGIYAVAGLRGGSEEGDAWHEAGRRGHKQNVFDDFAAAGDWLVATGRTARHLLAVDGRSNGGLLVGATLTQRPDLARAVHCGVPLLDMVRFPQFLIARLWTDEYGDPDVTEEFSWLHAYSPYHHVVEGACYPAVLLTTAEGDSRVDPLHARKMAAALQHASACLAERPVLLRQEGRAGHGVGKPLHKQADEAADVATFLAWQLGVAAPVTSG